MTKRGLIGSSASKIVCGANEDIISDLPKNVIDLILELMPIRDAVRTSVLSRKWQYRWVTTSELIFEDEFFRSLSPKYKTDVEVRNIINKILLLHLGHIHKFKIQIYHTPSLKNDLNQWLHFLSRNGIKEFSLQYLDDEVDQLGMQLYSCLELTHLDITNWSLNPPASIQGFPNLRILKLLFVTMNEKFGDVISACPWLERVSLEGCFGIRNLVVRAPNLKYFRSSVSGLKTIWLSSTKNLASFSIELGEATEPARMEEVRLGDTIFEFSAVSSVPKILPTSLDNLKKIVLHRLDFNDVAQVAFAVCMIRSSPKLTELEIWGQFFGIHNGLEPNFVEAYDDYDCSFDHLKTVKFKLLRDLKAEMALIKLLLASSPLLEQMSIYTSNEVDKNKALSICKKLMGFRRASPKATLIYLDQLCG